MLPVFSKYHADNVRAVKTLKPFVRALFYEGLIRLAANGIVGRITAAARTPEQQHELFLQGRPWLPGGTHGIPVTNADQMDSFHCWGVAIDFAPMRQFGPFYRVDYSLENAVARIWQDIGIEHPWPAGNKGFVDAPHFHYTRGLSIQDFKSGKIPPAPVFPHAYDTLPRDAQLAFEAMHAKLTLQGILPIL